MGYIKFDNSREFDIVPLGRAAIDFNPIDINMPLSESTTFKKYLGGSPANTAVGLARLGKKVGFIGKVSNDRFGEFVINYFKNEEIDTTQIYFAKNGENLGLTFTEILSPTESSILMYRNGVADLALEASEISEEYIKNTKAIIISGTALSQSPSREATLKALEYAKKNNTVVIFDIDYREYSWTNKDEIAIYYALVAKNSDVIIGSREEFDLTQTIIGQDSSDQETANRWFNYGSKIVVIKHGKDGSTAYTSDKKSFNIKPFPVKLLKSFGGGDAYGSAFVYGLLEGWDIIDCLEFGSASASMLVASHSCSDAMPKVEGINEFIRKSKEEYGEMVVKS
ncbi:5-dehydro-2-deoxygluconokinase [Clostridium sp. CM028]|uniref:5-dehydro-2-deoxygluconokinase n=1 Tax=Clostridium sp. CM028 TaxID=2851575 RepID=UPI001C6F0257|nr:5-dehydro-2-deoxygluconokinase [Clostridium sp. CM028]MBW9148904.1 5-dehydro-2-deoxygluconokinase [Clostridium sp. CM028]WLC62995.1 5-dehydro-2-deoxygluconokinase [Clostridium sp. CM028]